MNTLKPLLTVAVLAGIGYGVYVRINSGNDTPPAGVATDWAAPKVQLGDPAAPGGNGPWSPNGPSGPPIAPPFGGSRGPAPAATAPPLAARNAGEAPPYYPPGGGNAPPQNSTAPPPFNGPVVSASVPGDPVPPVPSAADPFASQPLPDAAPPPQSPAPPPVVVAPAGDPGSAERYGRPAVTVAPVAENGMVVNFAAVMATAKRELEAGQLASALQHLSSCYDNPQLGPAEQQQVTQLLDQVAGTVVYSTQHLLEPPYEVQANERLEDIGQRYNVPWQLLAKINGIDDPQALRPGERLKVVRGPFNAVVNLERRQLTLMLADGSYAGRFNIGIGREHPPLEGVYTVSNKQVNPVYHGRERAIGADDPSNPLGERFIGLSGAFGIHGTDRPENIGRTELPGSICLGPRDVEDVFDILTVGSKVTIRR